MSNHDKQIPIPDDEQPISGASEAESQNKPHADQSAAEAAARERDDKDKRPVREINGPKGLEPTRYGDWESKGRCHDF